MAETITNGHSQGFVGTRTIRPDGVDKVTGRARFGADYNLPGQLIGRVLRSPHPHARIVAIDTSKAEALPGVKAVITRDDFADQPSEFIPAGEMMMNYKDVVRNVMAREKALYEGHAVAAVAATSARSTSWPVASPPAWTTRAREWPPSRARASGAPAPPPVRSKEAPSAMSSRSRSGPSPTRTRTASGSHSPPPAERVSEKCSSGESPGDNAAATPPWA